ncbi:MAG: TonB-dependent receptor [Bacteroidota bacterium]|nr:TonB-dependent receptor [Bacteroidota bacterium]
MRHFILTISAFLFSISQSFAQNAIQISGQITDSKNQPIVGVAVFEAVSGSGAFSDEDGNYLITLNSFKDSAQLRFEMENFQTVKRVVFGASVLNIVMSEDVNKLNEVLVVGYGSSSKKELTGATTQVGKENIEKLNIPRLDQALQGQVAGVNIGTNSGSPGGTASIRIRGLSTFGDNDPLIVVDGVIYDSEGLNSLNPNDIESVNILKDATAGIYGVRAANGVILIETKKGKRNTKPQISISSYFGSQQPVKKLDLLNATEYAVIKNEMLGTGGNPLPFPNAQLGEGTDWQNAVFSNASIQNHNISIQGGSEKSTYSIGGSYFLQNGIVGNEKANFERLNGRVNYTTKLSDKLKLNSIFLYTKETRNALPENGIGSVLYNTINAFPTSPIKTIDGRYSYLTEVNDIINPIAQMENTYNTSWVNKFVGKEEIAYSINENLTFTNRLNYNVALVDNKAFSPLAWYGPGKYANNASNENLDPVQVEIADGVFIDRGASVTESRTTYTDLNYEGFLNHKKTIAQNQTLKSTLGWSIFKRRGENLEGTAFNIPNNSKDYADISANLAPGGFLNSVSSYEFEERLVSTFFRTEYNRDDRYLLSGILRRDGSSKFGPNNRFGFFPTLSAGWLLSEEPFFKSDIISFAKLRASFGVSGNDQIENFAYRAQLNGEGVYVFDDIITIGTAIGRASNPDLKWETTRQFNVGTDFILFNRINTTVNYFIKNTYDLLFQPDVSGIIGSYGPGGYPPIINAGNVSNKGIELEIRYNSSTKRALKLNAAYNITYLKNKVMETPTGVDFLPGANFGVGGNVATRFEKGFPIGYFHGYQTDGIFQTQEEIDNAPILQEGAKPGDFRFVDQNGDGKISFSDDTDKTMIGSPIPEITMGFNFNLVYKGFDVSGNLYVALGHEIIRNYERQQPYANQLAYVLDRWTGPNSTNDQARISTDLNRNGVFSDHFVESGNFARLRNLQFGYTLPTKFTSKISIQSMRIYFSANNLFTLTNYMGYDPDVSSGSALDVGVDNGFYPQAKTFMGGISIRL